MKQKTKFPRGWNEARVRRIIDYYENQSDEEAAAEDDAAFGGKGRTIMSVPTRLVPVLVRVIAAAEDRGRKSARAKR